jgi:hypothetical protein
MMAPLQQASAGGQEDSRGLGWGQPTPQLGMGRSVLQRGGGGMLVLLSSNWCCCQATGAARPSHCRARCAWR